MIKVVVYVSLLLGAFALCFVNIVAGVLALGFCGVLSTILFDENPRRPDTDRRRSESIGRWD